MTPYSDLSPHMTVVMILRRYQTSCDLPSKADCNNMAATASLRAVSAQILCALKLPHTVATCSSNPIKFCAFFLTLSNPISSSLSSTVSPERNAAKKFLLQECGFSAQDANDMCRRKPGLLGYQSYENSEQTVIFLKQRGFKQSDVRKIFFKCPNVLRLNLEKTVEPKIEFLERMGLTGNKLLRVLVKYPAILTLSIDRALMPRISYLQTVLDPKRGVGGSNSTASVEIPEKLDANNSQTLYVICKNPRILGRSVNTTLVTLVNCVEGLGLEKGSKAFVRALIMFDRMNEGTVKRKLEIMKGLGFSEEQVGQLVRRMPHVLEASEEKLRQNMEFLVEEWKLPRDVIAKTPALLLYGLEKRLRPRLEVLRLLTWRTCSNKGYFSLNFVTMSDDIFRQKVSSKLPVVAEVGDSP